MKKVGKVLKIVGNVIIWLFVAFSVIMTILVFSAQNNKDGLSNLFGKSMITVSSPSMSPTFDQGDLIFDQILTTDEISKCQIGDVITYYTDINGDGNDELNTHRIVDKYEEGGYTFYITRGDNKKTNTENDKDPVPYSKVLGKYTGKKLTGVGNVIGFLQTSTGFLCVIVIPLVVFFLFELYNFIAVVIKMKGKGKVSAEEEEEIKKRAVEEYLKQQNTGNDADNTADNEVTSENETAEVKETAEADK